MRHDGPSEELRRIAASKTRGYGLELSPSQREAAAALLADIYATGLRHGITPEDWAAVAGLDIECLDAIRWRDRVNRSRPRVERPFDHEPMRSLRSEQRGLELP
jgi:hypothetical protein